MRDFDILFTPGSDMFPVWTNLQLESIVGRNGNDVLLGFDPGVNSSNQRSIDQLSGDMQQGSGSTSGSDTFILGDWRIPYYSGNQEYAIITDFQTQLDTIKLHGNEENYFLSESGNDTELFLQQPGSQPDLIVILSDASNLTINADYFEFEGNAPPPTAINEIKQLGTLGVDEITSVVPLSDGDVYLSGYSSGSLGGSHQGSLDGWFGLYDSQGNQTWIEQIGSQDWDVIWDSDTDPQGNLYLLGMTRGNLAAPNSVSPKANFWVAKYDKQGNQEWIRQYDDADASFRIDVSDDGQVFTVSGVSITTQDIWNPVVGKYNTSNGTEVWWQEFGSNRPDESYAVAIDNQGNVFASGWTVGDVGGPNAGNYDVWIEKFDPSGRQEWSQQLGSSGFEWVWGVDTDSAGNVYLGGYTTGNLAGRVEGPYDAFLAKYNSEGQQLWIEQFGSLGDDEITNIFVSENDDIYVTGFTNGDLAGNGDASYNAFAAKYNSEGQQLWIEQLGSSGIEQPESISVDNFGNVYVTGVTDSSLGDTNQGSYDGWVAQLSATTGNLIGFGA